MKRAGRTDALHAQIRQALRQVGCSVHDTSQLGAGYPDLTVRTPDGLLCQIEVKSPRGRLTAAQERFLTYFPDTAIVHSVDEALLAVQRNSRILPVMCEHCGMTTSYRLPRRFHPDLRQLP